MTTRPKRHRLGGYVLVETLVSVSVAAVAAGMALQLLTWAVRHTAQARDRNEITQALSLVYEHARLLPPAVLDTPASGKIGKITWARRADAVDPALDLERVQPRRIWISLQSPNPSIRLSPVEATIWPAGAAKVE